MEGGVGTEPNYRVVTTILDPARAPAEELAALYPERGEIEGALKADEDPDRLSFVYAVPVIRRKLPLSGAISPWAGNQGQ